MVRACSAAAARRVSCGAGSRSGGGVGTWLKVAAAGLAFFAIGAVASDRSGAMRQQAGTSDRYASLRDFSMLFRARAAAVAAKLQGKDTQMYSEMNSSPPRPLQVFEYAPSRPAWSRDPEKYKYQYVCVVATMGAVEQGIWHRRKAPTRWKYQPPFHVRIVRPCAPGMLDVMLAKKKIRLAKKNVTMRRTDKRTGEVKETTKPMAIVERIDGDKMPKHIAEMIQAQKEGRDWKDTRPSKGRWGPSNLPEVKEEGIMELLSEAGIESLEEADDVTKVINKETGEVFDMKRAFDFGDTVLGYRRYLAAKRDAQIEADKKKKRDSKKRRK